MTAQMSRAEAIAALTAPGQPFELEPRELIDRIMAQAHAVIDERLARFIIER